jgi:hypothetical protein
MIQQAQYCTGIEDDVGLNKFTGEAMATDETGISRSVSKTFTVFTSLFSFVIYRT